MNTVCFNIYTFGEVHPGSTPQTKIEHVLCTILKLSTLAKKKKKKRKKGPEAN